MFSGIGVGYSRGFFGGLGGWCVSIATGTQRLRPTETWKVVVMLSEAEGVREMIHSKHTRGQVAVRCLTTLGTPRNGHTNPYLKTKL